MEPWGQTKAPVELPSSEVPPAEERHSENFGFRVLLVVVVVAVVVVVEVVVGPKGPKDPIIRYSVLG